MKSAQFFKGMINGVEEIYESPNLLQVLSSSKLAELWDLERIGTYNRVFLSDRVIAKTVVSKAVPDEHGRDGIVNHTVLYRFDQYITVDGATYRFDTDQFIEDVKQGKYTITMPSQPELKQPLDYPPPLEVKA